jgi:hypothetical protein
VTWESLNPDVKACSLMVLVNFIVVTG